MNLIVAILSGTCYQGQHFLPHKTIVSFKHPNLIYQFWERIFSIGNKTSLDYSWFENLLLGFEVTFKIEI
jgi:hypothetical protein